MRQLASMIVLGAVLFVGSLPAQDTYKKYDRTAMSGDIRLLEIAMSKESWKIAVFESGQENIYTIPVTAIQKKGRRVLCGDQITIDTAGIHLPDHSIPTSEIKRIDVDADPQSSLVHLIYFGPDTSAGEPSLRRRLRDRIVIGDSIRIAIDQFVRGSIITFFGDIAVDGEVNEDVVAIFGDITLGDSAVVRGDAISVYGEVSLQGGSVYGTVRSASGKDLSRRQRASRWRRQENGVAMAGTFAYNRVDGATLMLGVRYDHADSVIPSFRALGGYALASERWRYQLGLTQTVLRGRFPIQIGGDVHRLLSSDDDKLIGETENSVFALLVNEDWRDYYEAEGAYLFARSRIFSIHTLEMGYRTDEQRWLGAHPLLWSLFGAKEFRGNYSSVPYDSLRIRRPEFADRQITSLVMKYIIDSRDDEKDPARGWYGFAAYEYSPERWKGDFDFSRFEVMAHRYQPVGKYIALRFTGGYGFAAGRSIPLNRMFFVGGLGTIHGFRHKEYMGREYLLLSGEYLLDIPRTDISPFFHVDGGKIAPGGERLSNGQPWYSSIGIGLDFQKHVRLFVSKRLDRSGDDPVIYARFATGVF